MTGTERGGASSHERSGRTVSRTAAMVERRRNALAARVAGSGAEHLWRRLTAMDLINRAMLFAAVLLLCFVPFMIVVQSLAGRSAAVDLSRRFGLSHEAASDVSQVFTSPSATSSAVTGLSYAFFVLSGIAGATAVQELYERAYGLPGRGVRDLPRRLLWLACLLGAAAFAGAAGPWVRDAGGPVLLAVVAFVAYSGFWWFTIWLLLGGRRGWIEILPAALATSVCWLGAMIVFRITMSQTITTDYRKYGPIGVIFAVMSFLIATGVVIILGAVFGEVWRERRAGRKQPLTDLLEKPQQRPDPAAAAPAAREALEALEALEAPDAPE